ncbi:hypothetical protein ACFQY9_27640 [Microvirga aerilata]|uniref:hypothetical protein n=1 Tax=Microvirga aerilata TaxID=670292 RepID=UPI003628D354
MSIVDGLNLYAYVSNNPVTLQDAQGTQAHSDDELDAGATSSAQRQEGLHLETQQSAAENNARLKPGERPNPRRHRQVLRSMTPTSTPMPMRLRNQRRASKQAP